MSYSGESNGHELAMIVLCYLDFVSLFCQRNFLNDFASPFQVGVDIRYLETLGEPALAQKRALEVALGYGYATRVSPGMLDVRRLIAKGRRRRRRAACCGCLLCVDGGLNDVADGVLLRVIGFCVHYCVVRHVRLHLEHWSKTRDRWSLRSGFKFAVATGLVSYTINPDTLQLSPLLSSRFSPLPHLILKKIRKTAELATPKTPEL